MEKLDYWRQVIITYTVSIQDVYHQYRIELAIQLLTALYEKFCDFPNYTTSIVLIFNSFYHQSPIAKKWFDDRRQYKLLIS